MKVLKLIKDIKASPDLGKVCFYKKDEILSKNDERYSSHIEDWLIRNCFAVLVDENQTKEKESVQESLGLEEKALTKAVENKSLGAALQNKKQKKKGKK